jgi:hypothetical protein
MRFTRFLLGSCVLLLLASQPILAVPGDLIGNVNLPNAGYGVSVAVDCDGNVYYTRNGVRALEVMDSLGTFLYSVPTVDSVTLQALDFDEMAWDDNRGVLWAGLHASNPVDVYQIDPVTGMATFHCTSSTVSVGTFRDGLAYEGADDTLWLSGDVSNTIEHYDINCNQLGQITPTNAAGGTLGLISGVIVGVGDQLYLGRNGAVEIVRVRKSNGAFIDSFASPGGARDEGLECDAVNFPTLALWSREFNTPGFMSVIEIEEDTCVCGGGVTCEDPDPRTQGFWHRQCLGVAAADGGIDPGRNGRGPQSPTLDNFVPDLMDCAGARLEDLGHYGAGTCDGMDADPPSDACERAWKQTTALILNVCNGNLTDGCPVDVSAEGCSSTNVGDLLDELAALIAADECQTAADCAAAVNEGDALVNGGGLPVTPQEPIIIEPTAIPQQERSLDRTNTRKGARQR